MHHDEQQHCAAEHSGEESTHAGGQKTRKKDKEKRAEVISRRGANAQIGDEFRRTGIWPVKLAV
jgi:hypothetical protein